MVSGRLEQLFYQPMKILSLLPGVDREPGTSSRNDGSAWLGFSSADLFIACICFCAFGGTGLAADWNQYNGPLGDNSSPESLRTNWTTEPPKVLWRKPIGPGWSSISVSNGRLFTQERRETDSGSREFCVALEATSGTKLWAKDLDVAEYSSFSQTDPRADGPRSTPTVEGDFVYVSTSQLKLYCLKVADGTTVWSRDFQVELGSQNIPWENAASPLLVGDLIYVNSNAGSRRLMALNKPAPCSGGFPSHLLPLPPRPRLRSPASMFMLPQPMLLAPG